MTKQLSPEASRLLEQALLEERLPAPAELARVRQSLLRAAAAVAVTTGAAPLAAKTLATKAVWLGVFAKSPVLGAVVVGLSIGAVAAGGGTWVARQVEQRELAKTSSVAKSVTTRSVALSPSVLGSAAQPSSPPLLPHSQETTSELALPSKEVRRSENETPVVGTTKFTARESAPSAAAVARFDSIGHASLSEELARLEQAQRALNRGKASQALTLLEQLNASATGNGLLDERLALEALAACQTGQLERAQRAARQLLQRSPNSPLAGRIRASCAADWIR